MIEEIIFHSLFTNKEFYPLAKDIILRNENIFVDDNIYRSIKIMKHFVEEKRINPTYDDLILHIENDTSIHEKDYKSIIVFLQEQKKKEPFKVDIENLKEHTLKFIKDKLTMNILEKGAELLVGKNKKDTLESLQEDMKKVNALCFDSDLGNFLEDTEIFKEYDVDRVPIGFKPVDDLYGGGIPRGTFNVYLGGPHTGKSQTMLFLAVSAALVAGMKVTYITAEMSIKMTRQRIDSIFMEIPTLKLNPKNMSIAHYNEAWDEIRKICQGNINIKYFPSSTADANRVAKHIRDLKDKKDYVTDLLILDSINLMRPIDTRITKIQKHIWMEALTIDFREMSKELNLSTITAAQINRDGMKLIAYGGDPDMTVIGEFYMLGGFADSIIGIKQMYTDGQFVYNDKALEKITDESANDEFKMSDYKKKYDKIIKYINIKNRFGVPIDTYIFLGSITNISTLVDIGMSLNTSEEPTIQRKNAEEKAIKKVKKEYKEQKEKFKEETGSNEINSFQNRRKRLV